MILVALSYMLAVQSNSPILPVDRKTGEWCRGIHMPGPNGGANLLWTTFSGPDDSLKNISEKLVELKAWTGAVEGGTLKGYYRDDLDLVALGTFLNEVDTGKYGPVKTEDFMMSVDSLPPNKCYRR